MNEISRETRQGLESLFRSNRDFARIAGLWGNRQRGRKISTVDATRIQAGRQGLSASDSTVIALFRALQELDCGKYQDGRGRGAKGFKWAVDLRDVGKVAADQKTDVESFASESTVRGRKNVELLAYPHVLRDDLTITLRLPKDFTTSEATRLGNYLMSIAIPDKE